MAKSNSRLTSLLAILACITPFSAKADDVELDQLLDLSMENLLNIDVTIASKKKEKFSDVASAVYVITHEDIRRLGATTITDALRIVPGMHVAQLDSNFLAVSARGFNDQFANQMLVLMDGRTVYGPLFSGTFWDEQNIMMDNIERIEVIRGPGASVWGANAVNGVINIITRNAKDTQGTFATTSMGNREKLTGAVRYGGKSDSGKLHYQTYAHYREHKGEYYAATNQSAGEEHSMEQSGIRVDWKPSESDTVMTQARIYHSDQSREYIIPTPLPPYSSTYSNGSMELRGGHFLTSWEHALGGGDNINLQFYADRIMRTYYVARHKIDTLDVELKHQFSAGERHNIVWGAGIRHTDDLMDGTPVLNYNPSSSDYNLYSAFVQDQIALIPETLTLTGGARLEHHPTSGLEFQPNARLSWKVTEDQTLWASVSRAVRTPSRGEQIRYLYLTAVPQVPGQPAPIAAWAGNTNTTSENLLAYELGYRGQFKEKFSVDTSVFYHDYSDVISRDVGGLTIDPATGYPIIPLSFSNNISAYSYGIEASLRWDVLDNWSLFASYSLLEMDFNAKSPATQTFADEESNKSPQHQFHIRSYLNLPYNMELDTAAYYVDKLEYFSVPSYVRVDARLGWKPIDGVDISLIGQNLLDEYHTEYRQMLYSQPHSIGRSVFGKVTVQF